MKILLVNKFLYSKGGSETYVIKLGDILKENGHEVEFFGMEDEQNTLSNSANSYAPNIDFSIGISKNLTAPFKIIYSSTARKSFRKVLNTFNPDIVHFNNIQFHLTPSIILEAEKYRKEKNSNLKIIYTAHDYQLICPSHGLFTNDLQMCEKCVGGHYSECIKNKCVKNSAAKSILGAADGYFWKKIKAYSYIDTIICPSRFMKSKLDLEDRFKSKTVALHNFIDMAEYKEVKKEGYILEFGHLSEDKGTYTVIEAAKQLSEYKFIFAGFGEAEKDIEKVENCEYVGYKSGEELEMLIRKAAVTVCPSIIYENCPFSVIESPMFLTPVIGANIGGIPELIEVGKTGELFEAGNSNELIEKLNLILKSESRFKEYCNNCKSISIETPQTYYKKLISIYNGETNETI
jgi:glycosyltransferase involved in cell wall biosynthesis